MKYSLIFLSLLIASNTFISCNQISKEQKEYDALMQNVIDIHDEVMPKMSKISSLITQLKPNIDSTATGQSFGKAEQDLKNSYDYMMKWMSDFGTKFDHNPDDEPKEIISESKIKLLQEEEIEVKKLRDQINSSIDNAKKILDK